MSRLRDALRSSEFAITAELALTAKDGIGSVAAQAATLAAAADAVQVPDHRDGRPHISPVALGAELMQRGIDPVVRLNCRDRNRIAVQSELLTARAFGIGNLLLARGSELPPDHRPPASGVYDLGAIDLVQTAAAIRDGHVMSGDETDEAGDFFIGAVATAFKPKQDWTPEKLLTKADAGAQFIQLQLCMDGDVLKPYMARLVEARLTWRFQVLANVAVLTSAEAARETRRRNAGALLPPSLVRRLQQAADAELEGVAIAAETLRLLRDIPGIAGANLHTAGDADLIVAAVGQSGLR